MNLDSSNIKKTNGYSNLEVVIAELVNKMTKKTKNDETFYVLEISIKRSLTDMYYELRNENGRVPINSNEPLFVFTNEGKNRFAYTLEKNYIYAFWFIKKHNDETKEDFYHVKDWRKLSPDKRFIERSFRLISGKREEEEEELTNKEILIMLKDRMRNGKISFKLSAVNSDDAILDIDTDLRDNESNYRIDLQEEKDDELHPPKKDGCF